MYSVTLSYLIMRMRKTSNQVVASFPGFPTLSLGTRYCTLREEMSQSLILHHLYAYSSTLLETISKLAPWCTHLLQEDDPQSFHKLCRTTLIGSNAVDVLQSNASPTFIQGKRAELHELLPHIINVSIWLCSSTCILLVYYTEG